MKNQPRTDRKLPLRKEIVRSLSKLELGHVAGGDVTSTIHLISKSPAFC